MTQSEAPSAGEGYAINYAAETITVANGYEIYTAATNGTKINSGSIKNYISPYGTAAKKLYIRKVASGVTPASEWAEITVSARPATTMFVIDNDAKTTVQAAQTTVEYNTVSSDYSGTWTKGTGIKVALTQGTTVYFRVAPTTSSFASAVQTLNVSNDSAYTLTVTAAPEGSGTVGGSGVFNAGKRTVTAQANEGYVFTCWSENGVTVCTQQKYTFDLSSDRNLVAEFRAHVPYGPPRVKYTPPTSFTLRFETNGGSIIRAIRRVGSTEIDLSKYVPTRNGYTFAGWYTDRALTQKVEKVSITRNIILYAAWK